VTTADFLNNPLLLLGCYVGLRIADQALGDSLNKLFGRKNCYITTQQCQLLQTEHAHKIDTLLQELETMRADIRAVKQILVSIIDKAGVNLSGKDFINLVPPSM